MNFKEKCGRPWQLQLSVITYNEVHILCSIVLVIIQGFIQ